ncbi:hypothetical protein [Bradyrhizobium sp. LTSP885]|uniref:hypothetical protein n=1 Tax=Bradyrhizobium sp. LTSP885 TaxID=1619232 RepID=UPI000A8651C1|nr:hypothetical protein [Bradyrhizobium sp. LTSP885]
MALETLLVLLFTVFAIPGACFFVLVGFWVRGVWNGWKQQRLYRRDRAAWVR